MERFLFSKEAPETYFIEDSFVLQLDRWINE